MKICNIKQKVHKITFIFDRTKGEYKNGEEDEKFHYTLCLVLIQCFINAIYAKIGKLED